LGGDIGHHEYKEYDSDKDPEEARLIIEPGGKKIRKGNTVMVPAEFSDTGCII
jgi:hypothetical protein